MIRIMLVCNVVCQSADRFWAVVYPKSYHAHARRYVAICYLFSSVYPIMVTLTRFLSMELVDGICQSKPLAVDDLIILAIDSSLRYTIPIVFILVFNISVTLRLHSLGPSRTKPYHTDSISIDTVSETRNSVPNSALVPSSDHMSIFLSAILMTIEMTVLELLSVTLSVLNYLKLVDFSINSLARLYYCVFVALFAAFNPCLEILTITNLRRAMLNHWKGCFSPCKVNTCENAIAR
ncbi:unnamed protein product [Echinostoma caproni]|uniref:G_PROTEIN_RECEP_F1_2 domain-containing protein n=1 Tax=Echinostoma caproni TaxID=27848 RepID=A0A183A7V8_9TREM|nr:unnamed protein product [Echinostoma caproni]